MATATLPRSKRAEAKPRTLIRWDIYLIAADGTAREFARDLDEVAKIAYLETVSRLHKNNERIEARPVVYRELRRQRLNVESRNGRLIFGPRGGSNIKQLQREDRQRLREKLAELKGGESL